MSTALAPEDELREALAALEADDEDAENALHRLSAK